MTPMPQNICCYTAISFFECGWYVKKDGGAKCNFGLAADVQGNYGKDLTKDYIKFVRQKRQAYVKQNKTFHRGYQRELEEQLAKKRFKSKSKS